MSVTVQTWRQNKCQKTLVQTYCFTLPFMKSIFGASSNQKKCCIDTASQNSAACDFVCYC